jgi:hypothetical protein
MGITGCEPRQFIAVVVVNERLAAFDVTRDVTMRGNAVVNYGDLD